MEAGERRRSSLLSSKSNWQTGKAIRGGIPVCFPWFRAKADDAKAPAHGFVRTKEWRIESIAEEQGDAVCVRLSTESDDASRQWWPFDFRLDYSVTVGSELKLELAMSNTGLSELRFEEALHTYFRVGDVESACVRGLDGVAYLDNRDGNRTKTQSGDLQLAAQTDNAYLDATGEVVIFDPVLRRKLSTGSRIQARRSCGILGATGRPHCRIWRAMDGGRCSALRRKHSEFGCATDAGRDARDGITASTETNL